MKNHKAIIILFCAVSMTLSSCSEAVDLSKYSNQRSPNGEIVCVLKLSSNIHVNDMYDDDELTKNMNAWIKFDSEIDKLSNNQLFQTNDGQYNHFPSFYPCDISLAYAESVAKKYYRKNEMTLGISSVEAYKKALSRLKPIDEEMQKYLDESGFGKPLKED